MCWCGYAWSLAFPGITGASLTVVSGPDCPTPGKECYRTRRYAKQLLRRMPKHLRHLRAYRCDCGMFHHGTLEAEAIRTSRSHVHRGRVTDPTTEEALI